RSGTVPTDRCNCYSQPSAGASCRINSASDAIPRGSGITCRCSGRLARARRCWLNGFPQFCRVSTLQPRWKSRPFTLCRGALPPQVSLLTDPPFLAPHHTATKAAIVGGGSGIILPGSASLAHRGVLFLDEAPEFAKDVLDALRQPLEAGEVVVARLGVIATFP